MSNNLARIRGKHQITQSELAEKIGVTKQGLCFNEKKVCSAKMAKQAAAILNENVFDILGTDVFLIEPKTEEDKKKLINLILSLGTETKRNGEFGNTIKKLRKERRMTMQELSIKTGISMTTIGHFENGVRTPTAHNLSKLSLALECDYDYLFDLVNRYGGE